MHPTADSDSGQDPDTENPEPELTSSEGDDFLKGKNYNFPKLHLRAHLFKNIEDKGVTRNFSTKPNEKMHGPLKYSYQHRSNFKNYADQVGELSTYIAV